MKKKKIPFNLHPSKMIFVKIDFVQKKISEKSFDLKVGLINLFAFGICWTNKLEQIHFKVFDEMQVFVSFAKKLLIIFRKIYKSHS